MTKKLLSIDFRQLSEPARLIVQWGCYSRENPRALIGYIQVALFSYFRKYALFFFCFVSLRRAISVEFVTRSLLE